MPVSLNNTQIVFNDATTQSTAAVGFASGTVMLFAQTTAPTGFTKNTTTGNNSALRVTTGAVTTGGSVDFSTAFASQAVTITAVSGSAGNTTLSTPQIPSHTHPLPIQSPGSVPGYVTVNQYNSASPSVLVSNATGGGGAHNHPFSFSSATANAINLAVKFVDIIQATKN